MSDLPDFLKDDTPLDDYEASLLRQLKHWIRKKQLEYVLSKEGGAKAGNESQSKQNLLIEKNLFSYL